MDRAWITGWIVGDTWVFVVISIVWITCSVICISFWPRSPDRSIKKPYHLQTLLMYEFRKLVDCFSGIRISDPTTLSTFQSIYLSTWKLGWGESHPFPFIVSQESQHPLLLRWLSYREQIVFKDVGRVSEMICFVLCPVYFSFFFRSVSFVKRPVSFDS